MELLFYDIECFKYDSLVVFKTIDGKTHKSYWYSKNPEEMGERIYQECVKDHILVGYNNYYYDDVMLTVMMRKLPQRTLKKHNDNLIEGKGTAYEASDNIISLDVMQQIDVSKPSLKQIEGNMGKSILESSVPFNIDKELSEEQKREVERYCSYDVESTIAIYKLRKDSYFVPKQQLLDMVNKEAARKWNTTSIVASLLVENQRDYQRLDKIELDNWGDSIIDKAIWDMWKHASDEDIPEERSYTIDKFGCEVVFGFGGLHGAPVKPIRCKNVKLLDVGSMYPSIIILQNALGKSTEVYDSIRKERLSIKHTDPVRATALKLILNSTYGLLKNKHSRLYNPKASSKVCIYGQVALFDLCLRISRLGYRIININTDGIAFDDPDGVEDIFGDIYLEAQKSWERDYNLYLELDTFDTWIQRDVNNYIATQGEHVKVKGGDVNKAFKNEYFRNNNARIVDKGVVYALLHKDDEDYTDLKLLEYITDHLDQPLLFQYVLKAGKTFKGVYDSNGDRMQNVNRVFALNPNQKGTVLKKVRIDGGYVNFPNAPTNMIVWNDDVDNIKDFDKLIDINHYYQLIKKKLEGWDVY